MDRWVRSVKIDCDVYKGLEKEDYYLYVNSEDGLSRVPQALQDRFGGLEKTLSFELTRDRRLAREDAAVVYENLIEQGYHLQLPPADGRFRE